MQNVISTGTSVKKCLNETEDGFYILVSFSFVTLLYLLWKIFTVISHVFSWKVRIGRFISGVINVINFKF
jgi:hypothetical protein